MSDERYPASRAETALHSSGTLRAEDADALAADLAERFTLRLRLFAQRRLRDAAAAEDTVQEALREVLKALRAGRVATAEALPGFVFQTAKNLCMHHGRSAGRRDRAILAFSRLPQSQPEDALLVLVREERRSAVRDALARLDEGDRKLLALCFEDGLDAVEIGRLLGVAPGAVRVRKHRSLRKLAALLGEPKSNETEGEGTP
jgi:RNA polymerase sigma factor (sigma-70 family)